MKYLKLFEYHSEIDSICRKFDITNYTVNGDGTVDVYGDVTIKGRTFKELPIKFGKVYGNFYCHYNSITTLEGAPKEVGGNFQCNNNKLTNLGGSPNRIGGSFGKPEKVSADDCIKKYKRYSKLKFSDGEVEFFNKFSELNTDYSSTLDNDWKDIFDPNFKIYSKGNIITRNIITIIKLDDNWYLISEINNTEFNLVYEFYICDEWEEVLGYLSSSHHGFEVKS